MKVKLIAPINHALRLTNRRKRVLWSPIMRLNEWPARAAKKYKETTNNHSMFPELLDSLRCNPWFEYSPRLRKTNCIDNYLAELGNTKLSY